MASAQPSKKARKLCRVSQLCLCAVARMNEHHTKKAYFPIMSKIDGFINWLYFWKVFAAGWTGFEPTRLTGMALRTGMSKFEYVRLSCNSEGNISSLVWIKLKLIRLLLKDKNSSESKNRMNGRDGFFTLFNGEKPNNKQKIINSSKELGGHFDQR